jgi:hypothetical protein
VRSFHQHTLDFHHFSIIETRRQFLPRLVHLCIASFLQIEIGNPLDMLGL